MYEVLRVILFEKHRKRAPVRVGPKKANKLKKLLDPLGVPIKIIGDALQPRSAMEAIREGFEFGFSI